MSTDAHRNPAATRIGILAAVAAATILGAGAAAAETVRVDPSFRVGERLHYTWHLENDLSWSPPSKGADWAKMTTDLGFVLAADRLDESGGCLFDLEDGDLESVGESEKGKIGVRADMTEASYLLGKRWTKPGPNTPFKKPITITLGPRFQPTGSTGVEQIALFLLPGVDPRVWFVVTTAPEGPLTIGSSWSTDFDVEIPGAKGDPLHVVLAFEVVGIETVGGARAVTLEAQGELNLTDSDLQMKDGSWLHVVHGTYHVEAIAKWDLDRGYLRFAEATQTLKATADRPSTMRLASEAVSRLSLDRVERP